MKCIGPKYKKYFLFFLYINFMILTNSKFMKLSNQRFKNKKQKMVLEKKYQHKKNSFD
jgi:hypothetical protein